MIGNGKEPPYVSMLDWLIRIIAIVLVPLLIWMSGTIVGMGNRVTAIEASRFTAADGSRVWEELYKRPTFDQVPPAWFQDFVERLDMRLTALEDKVR